MIILEALGAKMMKGSYMQPTISTIFEHETDNGKIGTLGIDDNAHLYWNGQPVVTERKIKLSWWVNFAMIVGGLSTAIIAIFTVLMYYKSFNTFASSPPNQSVISSSTELFQLHTGPNGRVYRIDTRTGKSAWLDGSIFREISESTMPELLVGKIYRGEDGTSTYKYEGSGRFLKWGLDRYFTPPQDNSIHRGE